MSEDISELKEKIHKMSMEEKLKLLDDFIDHTPKMTHEEAIKFMQEDHYEEL